MIVSSHVATFSTFFCLMSCSFTAICFASPHLSQSHWLTGTHDSSMQRTTEDGLSTNDAPGLKSGQWQGTAWVGLQSRSNDQLENGGNNESDFTSDYPSSSEPEVLLLFSWSEASSGSSTPQSLTRTAQTHRLHGSDTATQSESSSSEDESHAVQPFTGGRRSRQAVKSLHSLARSLATSPECLDDIIRAQILCEHGTAGDDGVDCTISSAPWPQQRHPLEIAATNRLLKADLERRVHQLTANDDDDDDDRIFSPSISCFPWRRVSSLS